MIQVTNSNDSVTDHDAEAHVARGVLLVAIFVPSGCVSVTNHNAEAYGIYTL